MSRPVAVDISIATLAILLIASPLLFTSNGFALDFTNSIWLVGYQQHLIATYLHPSLFLQTQQLGVFYPFFAFYGGTLFAFTGAIAVILGGSTILAFTLVTLAAIAAAYGGFYWIARQLGVRGALAHAPALVFVTSAYYVTNLYGRGAWSEFVAVSALPVVAAASLRLVRARWHAGPVMSLVAASAVLSGSHNITFLWGSTVFVLGLILFWALSGCSHRLPWRRVAATAAVIALGVTLNGWFLLPDLFYSHETLISGYIHPWSETGYFNTPGVIFDPLRTVPESETPALYVQAPVLALAWGLLAAPFARRDRYLRAGVLTVLIILVGLLALIMSSLVWSWLPRLYQETQYAYRLQSYVALSCSTLVLLGAMALAGHAGRPRIRLLQRGLWIAVAFGVALSVWQLWVPNTRMHLGADGPESYSDRAAVLQAPPTVLPKSWYAGHDFSDSRLPVIERVSGSISFDPARVSDNQVGLVASFPQGPFSTNIAGGPNLVHVGGGVRVVGRTTEGDDVFERTRAGSEPVPVDLSAGLSAPVIVGRIVSNVAAFLLIVVAAVGFLRRRQASLS